MITLIDTFTGGRIAIGQIVFVVNLKGGGKYKSRCPLLVSDGIEFIMYSEVGIKSTLRRFVLHNGTFLRFALGYRSQYDTQIYANGQAFGQCKGVSKITTV